MVETRWNVNFEFSDCDPASIIWFPNHFRWLDAASRHFSVHCGIWSWRELQLSERIIGTPLVSTATTFVTSASYGDRLTIRTNVVEWGRKSFVQSHRVQHISDNPAVIVLHCKETRVFAAKLLNGSASICAVPIPDEVRRRCS